MPRVKPGRLARGVGLVGLHSGSGMEALNGSNTILDPIVSTSSSDFSKG